MSENRSAENGAPEPGAGAVEPAPETVVDTVIVEETTTAAAEAVAAASAATGTALPIPSGPVLTAGSADAALSQALSDGLDGFNFPATNTTAADQTSVSVKVVDEAGELLGGLTGWTWGGLFGISMLWVRDDARKDGWGSKILVAAEEEARKRGCDRACVSSFTFQAPGFYQKHGYYETGRTLGFPNGAEDVHMFKKFS